jgi:8-oxo-dGTP pyrophosphatase MutT (NUDIX family)
MPPWETIEEAPEGDYSVFSVRRQRVRSPTSGQTADFHVIDAPDWVNVVPVTAGGEVVCVRQYRPGTDEVTLEIPGGMIDAGERPVEAARRELLEETGCTADPLVSLGVVDPNPAIQSNCCHTFLAPQAVREQPAAPDDTEELTVEHVPLADTGALVRDGRIRHALVVVAFHLLEQYVETRPTDALPW